jgi:hypothetical protein
VTLRAPRDTQLHCDTCGHTTPLTTAGLAAKSMAAHSCTKRLAAAARSAQHQARMANIDRTPKPCLHKVANHQHGTYAAYVLDGCRCLPCNQARSKWERDTTRAKAYGRWNGYVPAERARDHVRSLMDQGMGLKRIVEVSGVAQGVMWKLVYGKTRPDGTRNPSARIRPETEQRLLATKLDLAGGVKVPFVGTRRRLQALVATGWSIGQISARTGLDRQRLDGAINGRDIVQSTADAVNAAYDELWNQAPPQSNQRERIAVSRSRKRAALNGWAPPMAWDDDSIDDPNATPDLGEQRNAPGRKRIHLEDVEFLVDNGHTLRQIAHRLNVQKSAIEHACARSDRRDLLERMKRNEIAQENAA